MLLGFARRSPCSHAARMLRLSAAVAMAWMAAMSHAQSLKAGAQLLDKPDGAGQGPTLPAGTPLKVVGREGFWVRVEGAGKLGWLKASGLSFAAAASGATAIDTGRLGKGNIVSTSATRGLSARDLLNGSPRPEQVASMASQVPEPAAVQGFQSQGALQQPAQKVALRAVTPAAVAAPAGAGQVPGGTGAPPPSASRKKDGDDW